MELLNFFSRKQNRETTAAGSGTATTTEEVTGGNYQLHAVRGSVNNALSVAAFYRAIDLRANMLSMVKVTLQRKNTVTDNYVMSEGNKYDKSDKFWNYLWQVHPNKHMTAVQLIKQASMLRDLTGNALIYIERGGEFGITNLWLASSGSYNPTNDTYTLTFPIMTGITQTLTTSSENVIHWRADYQDRQGWGLPILAYGEKILSLAATNDKQSLDMAAKGGRFKMLLKQENKTLGLGKTTKNQMEKAKEDLAKQLDQDVVLMPNFSEAQIISQSAADQQINEARKFSVAEIARLTGVPGFLLMDTTNGSYKSATEARYDLMQSTLAPAIMDLENELDLKLLGWEDYMSASPRKFHLCEKALLRLDVEGQAKIDQLHLQSGWSLNEVRAQYDLPSLGENGDRHYYSANLKCAEVEEQSINETNNNQEGGEE